MSILKVAKLGNPVLRQISQPVPKEAIKSHVIQRLIKDMIATMREYGGVGLAAPQVHESVQIAVIEGLEGTRQGKQKPTQLQVLINPTLTVVSDELVEDWEGCLSIPDLRGQVPRYREVQVRALGPEGEQVDFRAAGFHARVIQHEHDHLIGKMFLDRMRSFESLSFLAEFTRYWQDKSDGSTEGSS
jgi:peptide deformylase